MATSGTYTETRTATQLVTASHRVIGVTDPDEALDPDMMTHGIQTLNDIIYQWKGAASGAIKSAKVWQRETVSITLVDNQESYSLKPSGGDEDIQIPEEILTVNMQVTSGTEDTPLTPMTMEEYQEITDKTLNGTATRYYYEKRLSEGVVYLDLVPNTALAAANTLEVVYRQPLEIITAGTNEFDFPKYWFRALKYNLAMDLCCEYPVEEKVWTRVVFLARHSIALTDVFETEFIRIYDMPAREIA